MKVIKKILLFILLLIFSPLIVGYAFFMTLKHFKHKNKTTSDLEIESSKIKKGKSDNG